MAEFERKWQQYLVKNPGATEYCDWQGVDCPVNLYKECGVRNPALELLEYLKSARSQKGSKKAQQELENIAESPCPLEETLGVRVDE